MPSSLFKRTGGCFGANECGNSDCKKYCWIFIQIFGVSFVLPSCIKYTSLSSHLVVAPVFVPWATWNCIGVKAKWYCLFISFISTGFILSIRNIKSVVQNINIRIFTCHWINVLVIILEAAARPVFNDVIVSLKSWKNTLLLSLCCCRFFTPLRLAPFST